VQVGFPHWCSFSCVDVFTMLLGVVPELLYSFFSPMLFFRVVDLLFPLLFSTNFHWEAEQDCWTILALF